MEKGIYKCVSKKGPETTLMSEYFTIGQKYVEVDKDFLGGNECDEDSLLLESDYYTEDDYVVPMYVDKEDFELVGLRTAINLN